MTTIEIPDPLGIIGTLTPGGPTSEWPPPETDEPDPDE